MDNFVNANRLAFRLNCDRRTVHRIARRLGIRPTGHSGDSYHLNGVPAYRFTAEDAADIAAAYIGRATQATKAERITRAAIFERRRRLARQASTPAP